MEKETAKSILAQVRAAMREIGAEHGLIVEVSRGTLRPDGLTARVTFAPKVQSANPLADTPHGQAWLKHATEFGLRPEDLGRDVRLGGRVCTLIGLLPMARKRPVVIRDHEGEKVYMLAPVREALGAS